MKNVQKVRCHICEHNHQWYTDVHHTIEKCPECDGKAIITKNPVVERYNHVEFGYLLGNFAAAVLTAESEKPFGGWMDTPKVKYWELILRSRIERLERRKR